MSRAVSRIALYIMSVNAFTDNGTVCTDAKKKLSSTDIFASITDYPEGLVVSSFQITEEFV